ncbi:MAG TPA: PKD domain-containing protein [Candidatus Limnocylindria bacterium]|nr:PKD domain-containing protein [Candidatus Limnocylindria bacterium]
MRRTLLLVLSLALLAGPAEARRAKFDELMQILTPTHKGVGAAHPHVNVIVLFGRTTKEGVGPDLATFQAKLNGQDVTSLFVPLEPGEFGVQSGMRAVLEPARLKLGAKNQLKLSVRSNPFPMGKRMRSGRDKDRIKFTVEETENQLPVAVASADTDTVFPGLPVAFDGGGSTDPDFDPLTYTWDFGDGEMGSGERTEHTYGPISGDLLARLTVSDGSADAEASIVLQGEPDLDEGRTKGLLQVTADGPLELGAVAVGATGRREFTVTNLDATETSQLKVRLEVRGDGFTLEPESLDLGPEESAPVTVTFAPTAEGHAHAKIAIVASASNRAAVSTIAHGYGGAAPAGSSGPTLADRTAFYAQLDISRRGLAVFGLRPDGTRFFADNSVHTCVVPGGGTGTGDACVTNADCAAHGGYCPPASTCRGGANAGQPCTTHDDCPGSDCPSFMLLDPEEICSGTDGSYVILSEEGSFTDPNFNAETERAATLMRVDLAPDGTVTGRQILDRPTEETTNLACDGLSVANGRVFIAEYFNVDLATCFRTEKERLTTVRKATGAKQVLLDRLDSVQGIDACNDIEDSSSALASSRDGSIVYATFDVGGSWRVRPSPLAFLTFVPDGEVLEVHPDGSLLYANATDSGTEGRVNVYKISAGRVATGPLPVGSLVPCATLTVPNNGGRTFVQGLAAASSASNPDDALILVSFLTSASGVSGVLGGELRVRGVAAFVSPPGASDTCSVAGLISLEPVEQLTF